MSLAPQLPPLRLRVLSGGRQQGPTKVEAFRYELSEREEEAVAFASAIIDAAERIHGAEMSAHIPSMPVLHEAASIVEAARSYREASRERAGLLDPMDAA